MSDLVEQLNGGMLCGRTRFANGGAEQGSAHSIYTGIHFLEICDVYETGRLGLGFSPSPTSPAGFPFAAGLFSAFAITRFGMVGIRVLQANIITDWADWHR